MRTKPIKSVRSGKHKNTKRLVKAVLSNNFYETKRIITEGNFDKTVLDDLFRSMEFYDDGDYYPLPPIPLYYVSLCNQIYLSRDWSQSLQSLLIPCRSAVVSRCRQHNFTHSHLRLVNRTLRGHAQPDTAPLYPTVNHLCNNTSRH